MISRRLSRGALALACVLSATSARAAGNQVDTYLGPAGAYLPAQGAQLIGYDSVTGQTCVVGKTATCSLVVAPAGSAGHDFSANAPALPNVTTTLGTAFGGSTAMSSWVLLATIPAAMRNGVRISAPGGQRVAYIEDDGTAAVNAAPVNASLDFVDPGSGLYTQGGDQVLVGHVGRFSIYGPSGTFVTARIY
jgi:hypothetical protein